jgi:DNA (cytosine-5)-methyltransferase 1
LEPDAPMKYCLSKTACEGILRRAAKRGKELPPMLREALEAQCAA